MFTEFRGQEETMKRVDLEAFGNKPEVEKSLFRFWKKVVKTPSCWNWIGAKTNKGYGQFYFIDRLWVASRWICSVTKDVSIPKHLDVCHQCDNGQCVNPKHLFIGTRSDNVQDCISKGRYVVVRNFKTGCYKGHRFSDDNLIINRVGKRAGKRRCKICAHATARKCYLKKQALAKLPPLTEKP